MASPAARKRLSKEYQAMSKSSPPFIWAQPDEKNILNWYFILRGPPDSVYQGGEYFGIVLFPSDYPFKPPDIKIFTPSGRFKPDTKICTSMTSFHPTTWNPAWSVATILTGLLSFWLSDEVTSGGIGSTIDEKRTLALASHGWNLKQKKFRDMFPDYSGPQMKDVPDMGIVASSPSTSKATDANSTTTLVSPTTSTALRATPSSPVMKQPIDSIEQTTSATTSITSISSTTTAASSNPATNSPSSPAGAVVPAASAALAVKTRSWSGSKSWRWLAVVVAALVVGRLSSLLNE